METKNLPREYRKPEESAEKNYKLIDEAIEKHKRFRNDLYEKTYREKIDTAKKIAQSHACLFIILRVIIYLVLIAIIISIIVLTPDAKTLGAIIMLSVIFGIPLVWVFIHMPISDKINRILSNVSDEEKKILQKNEEEADKKALPVYSRLFENIEPYKFLGIPREISFKDGFPCDNNLSEGAYAVKKYGSFTRFVSYFNDKCYHRSLTCRDMIPAHYNTKEINVYDTTLPPCGKCAANEYFEKPDWYVYYRKLLEISEKYPGRFPNISKDMPAPKLTTEEREELAKPTPEEFMRIYEEKANEAENTIRIYNQKLTEFELSTSEMEKRYLLLEKESEELELEREELETEKEEFEVKKRQFNSEKSKFKKLQDDFEKTLAEARRENNMEICVKNLVSSNFIPVDILPLYELSLTTSRAEKAAHPTFEFITPISVSCLVRSATSGETYHTSLTSCTCKDFIYNNHGKMPCKHMLALAFNLNAFRQGHEEAVAKWERHGDGTNPAKN